MEEEKQQEQQIDSYSPKLHFPGPNYNEAFVSQIDAYDLNGAENVFQRVYNGGIKRKIVMYRHAEEQARLKCLEDMKAAPFAPKLCKATTALDLPPLKERIDRNIKRYEHNKIKNQQQAKQREEAENQMMPRNTTHMNDKSRQLLEGHGYRSPQNALRDNAFMRSMWRELKPNDALWLASSSVPRAGSRTKSPEIARSLSTGQGMAGDRLYNLAVAKKQLKDSEKSLTRVFGNRYTEGGHPLSRSVVDRSSSNPTVYLHNTESSYITRNTQDRSLTKFDLLHAEGEAVRRNRERMVSAREHSFKPKFYSELADVKPKYLQPVFTRDQDVMNALKDTGESGNNRRQLGSPGGRSSVALKKESEVRNHIDKLLEGMVKVRENKAKLRESLEKERCSVCVFSPDLSKITRNEDVNSAANIAAAAVAAMAEAGVEKRRQVDGKNTSVFDALYVKGLERKTKLEKIQRERELQKEETEVSLCTFRPKISDNSAVATAAGSDKLKSMNYSFSSVNSGASGRSFSIDELGSFVSANRQDGENTRHASIIEAIPQRGNRSNRSSRADPVAVSFSNHDLESLLDVPTDGQRQEESGYYAAKQLEHPKMVEDRRVRNIGHYDGVLNGMGRGGVGSSNSANPRVSFHSTTFGDDSVGVVDNNDELLYQVGDTQANRSGGLENRSSRSAVAQRNLGSGSGFMNGHLSPNDIDILDALISAPTPDLKSLMPPHLLRSNIEIDAEDIMQGVEQAPPQTNSTMYRTGATPKINSWNSVNKDSGDYVNSILSQMEAGTII